MAQERPQEHPSQGGPHQLPPSAMGDGELLVRLITHTDKQPEHIRVIGREVLRRFRALADAAK